MDSKRFGCCYIERICNSRSGGCGIDCSIRHRSITFDMHTVCLGLCFCVNSTTGNIHCSAIVVQTIGNIDICDTFYRTATHIACIAGRNQHSASIVANVCGSMQVLCTDITTFDIQSALCDINGYKLTTCCNLSFYLSATL